MMMKIINLIVAIVTLSCIDLSAQSTNKDTNTEKIKVLNFGTFHMGSSSDSVTVNFDDKSTKNQKSAKKIAESIAAFKPTVICVERDPDDNELLNEKYANFLRYPDSLNYYGEIGLIAFEVGRLSEVPKLYGIDHKMEYNYNINESLNNSLAPDAYTRISENLFAAAPDLNPFVKGLSVKEKLLRINHPKFLDIMILANADILAYVGTENGFEGADEAAKYYQRNLRIYSNLNRLDLDKSDRVFILSGGSHTAFLKEFLERSPVYEVVDTFKYLN